MFSRENLGPALQALRAKAGGKLLRLEIRARELTLQAEDPSSPGAVVEWHYRDGKVGGAYGVEGIPQTVVIGKDGKVKKVFIGFGPDSPKELQKAVDSAK